MRETVLLTNSFNHITYCGKEVEFNNEKTKDLWKKLHKKSCPKCKSNDIHTNISLTINVETPSRKSNKKMKKLV